ncbi:MAG: D-alanine--D-alanine ligase, partial [Chloroflexi bacterium]|nr:D-alanine--D-alanine ligase [Chloroflexota bacterium]
MDKRRIRVGVLFGGRSGEHEVSLRSARSIMDAIDPNKYEIVPVGITKEGRWVTGPDPLTALQNGADDLKPTALLGEPGERTLRGADGQAPMATIDVIFPVLHGPFGEDGSVQGLLELAAIPYVGAGVAGSAVGMDKALFKAVMRAHDIPVLPYTLLLRSEWEFEAERMLNELEAAFSYPMFAKPCNLGSSVGVSKARNRAELKTAIDAAAAYDRRVLVEQGIEAREIEVSVLGNDQAVASVPGEVVPGDEFYSYNDKYINDEAKLLIPAPLTDEQAEQVRQLALKAFMAIDGAGLARVDFLMDKATDALYINE